MQISWSRWYRKAVEKSALQVFGAERWIKQFPEKIYIDKKCTISPYAPVPSGEKVKFHRILIANGAVEACKSVHGGSGSLYLNSTLSDLDHVRGDAMPFTVG